MAITKNDIKLFQAQDNTDNDSGGGSRTSNEVVDGAVNNLFPDISRIDTVSGDVALRKVFPTVATLNQDVYYGAHAILRKTPTDPKVSSLIVYTDAPHDRRVSAQNKIESYVTGSYREQFWLFGAHIVNATAITFLQNTESLVPEVGNVYLLKEGADEQYVRVTEIESLVVNLTFDGSTYKRRRIIALIDQPLNFAFTGSSFHPSGQLSGSADTFATQLGTESKFYSTKTLVNDMVLDDNTLQVDSIYEQLVPATKQTTALVNQPAVASGQILVPTGNIRKVYYSGLIEAGDIIQLPDAVAPFGMVSIDDDGVSDDGKGNLTHETRGAAGTIDYKQGIIYYEGYTESHPEFTYESAIVFDSNIQFTADILVDSSNQAFTYVRNLNPMPSPLDLYIDYRAQGKWYRVYNTDIDSTLGNLSLLDNFDGTGTVTISLSSVPDIDSSVIVSSGSGERVTNRQAFVAGQTQVYLEFDLGQKHIDPLSFVVQVRGQDSYGLQNLTCDAQGVITDELTNGLEGYVDLIDGKLIITGNGFTGRLPPDINYIQDVIIDFDYSDVTGGEAGVVYEMQASNTPTGDQQPLTEDNTAGTLVFNIGENVNIGRVTLYLPLHAPDYYTRPLSILLRTDSNGDLRMRGASDQSVWGSVAVNGDVSMQFPVRRLRVRNPNYTGLFGGGDPYINVMELNRLRDGGVVDVNYQTERPTSYLFSHNITDKIENISKFKIQTVGNIVGEVGFIFSKDSNFDLYSYFSKQGVLYVNATSTGIGTQVGTIDYVTGTIEFAYTRNPDLFFFEFTKLFSDDIGNANDLTPTISFRTAATKLTTSSFQLRYETANGSASAIADNNGVLWDSVTLGVGTGLPTDVDQSLSRVDTLTGMASITFTSPAVPSSIKYDAIAETTLPLDPELLGLDPVRLPSDGRVPVFKAGTHLVIFHEQTTATTNATPIADDVETLSRSGQSYIEVIDVDGYRLDPIQYVADKAAGTVTFANPLVLEDKYNVALTAPFSVVDRMEDMLLATDVEINGSIKLSGGVSYAFPKDETKVASALVWGDIGARTYGLFSQEIWDSGNPVWDDTLIGDPTTSQYDTINNPIQIDNESSSSGRWAIIFTGSTTVKVAEEKLGIVDQNISISVDDVSPINPATGNPYFTMPKEGFGVGWVANNVIRFNTDSGDANMWLIRTVQSGALSEDTDSIDIEIRGDAN